MKCTFALKKWVNSSTAAPQAILAPTHHIRTLLRIFRNEFSFHKNIDTLGNLSQFSRNYHHQGRQSAYINGGQSTPYWQNLCCGYDAAFAARRDLPRRDLVGSDIRGFAILRFSPRAGRDRTYGARIHIQTRKQSPPARKLTLRGHPPSDPTAHGFRRAA